MKDKRETSAFIPYRQNKNGWEFYLQKRDVNARSIPGVFGMFGGGFENNETAEAALYREIKEELSYTPPTSNLF